MSRRPILSALLLSLALLTMTLTARAGNWATVEVERPPTEARVGSPLVIDFTLLRHGESPVSEIGGQPMSPRFEARHLESGERLTLRGSARETTGDFSVTVDFPRAGIWEWQILPDPLAGEMAPARITVQPAARAALPTTLPRLPIAITLLALLGTIGWWRRG